MPSAHAMKSLIAPAMGVGAWYLIKTKFPAAKAFIEKTLNNGYKRAAVFGAFALMAGLASRGVKKDAEKMRERAKAYRDLAAKMRRRLGLQMGMNTGTLQHIPPVTQGNKNLKPDGFLAVEQGSCAVGKTGEPPQIDTECLCKKNNSCKKTTLPKVDYPELPTASTALSDASNMLKDYSDKTYNGDLSGSAKVSDASISNSAAKVDKLKRKLWNMAQNHFKKNGSKLVAGDRLESSYAARLKKTINSDFQKLSAKDKGLLANLSSDAMSKSQIMPAKKSEKKNLSGPSVGGKGFESNGEKMIALDRIDIPEEKEEDIIMDEQKKEEIVANEFSDKSVNENQEQSIWKILSNRYLKLYSENIK